MIKRAAGLIKIGKETIKLEKEYGNIKKTGNYFYPFSVTSYANDTKNIEAEAGKVVFNREINEAVFHHQQ